MNLLNRSGLAAVAAATAFLSTPALAQDASPVAADPAPIVADAPLASEPVAAPQATSDTLAPAPAAQSTRTVKSTKTVIASRSVVPIKALARPVVTARVAAAPIAMPAAPVEAPADPAMVAPIPEPVAPAPVAAVESTTNDMLPIAGAAGLGLLALAGAAFAIRRRRRDDEFVAEENWVEPDYVAAAPVVAAPIAATSLITSSAFAWGDQPAIFAPASTPEPAPTGMSWIEAAKRGPTKDNPSRSLKKRLSRAVFFEQRDRLVAAGKADPVSPMAGLPDRLAKAEQPQRRTKPAMSLGFNRQFQPA